MAAWKPTEQVGTSWVPMAEDHDVYVLFCLCIVKLVIGILSSCSGYLREAQIPEYSEIPDNNFWMSKSYPERLMSYLQVGFGRMLMGGAYLTNVYQLVVPVLGICAVKLDSQEFLKVCFSIFLMQI